MLQAAAFALDEGLWYSVACAVGFGIAGLVVGYFIWRKGNMQTHEAEAEVRATRAEIERLSEDLKVEEAELGGGR